MDHLLTRLQYFNCFRFSITPQKLQIANVDLMMEKRTLLRPQNPVSYSHKKGRDAFYYFITDIVAYNLFWKQKFDELLLIYNQKLLTTKKKKISVMPHIDNLPDIEKAWYISLEILMLDDCIYGVERANQKNQIVSFTVNIKNKSLEYINPFFTVYLDPISFQYTDDKQKVLSDAIINHWTNKIKFAYNIKKSSSKVNNWYSNLDEYADKEIYIIPFASGFIQALVVEYIYGTRNPFAYYFHSSNTHKLFYKDGFPNDNNIETKVIKWFNTPTLFKPFFNPRCLSEGQHDVYYKPPVEVAVAKHGETASAKQKKIEQDFENLSDSEFVSYLFNAHP